eukprot:354946-Chlamydomonas_euryale.AAC.3
MASPASSEVEATAALVLGAALAAAVSTTCFVPLSLPASLGTVPGCQAALHSVQANMSLLDGVLPAAVTALLPPAPPSRPLPHCSFPTALAAAAAAAAAPAAAMAVQRPARVRCAATKPVCATSSVVAPGRNSDTAQPTQSPWLTSNTSPPSAPSAAACVLDSRSTALPKRLYASSMLSGLQGQPDAPTTPALPAAARPLPLLLSPPPRGSKATAPPPRSVPSLPQLDTLRTGALPPPSPPPLQSLPQLLLQSVRGLSSQALSKGAAPLVSSPRCSVSADATSPFWLATATQGSVPCF